MTDDDYRALIEQSHMLDELARNPGWAVLVDYLQVFSEAQQRRLLNGRVETIEEYKKIAGELIGVQKAIDAPEAVARMLDAERGRRVDANEPTT